MEFSSEALKDNPPKQAACVAAELPVNEQPFPASALTHLKGLSVNNNLQEMRKLLREAKFVAGKLAISGQITVFYAAPNTGKTLITLKLVSESIANDNAGENVFYINLDDTYEGLITKAELGDRYGFNVLGPEVFTKPLANFTEVVDKVIKEQSAGEAVFILDTVKKFVDVMDKKASSQFMNICRRFTAAGGTIIALAHVNKRTNDSDEGIPAGTSDILDDCDCAYVMNNMGEATSTAGTTRAVEFLQKKARGPSAQRAVYQYRVIPDEYFMMLSSVKLVDGDEADRISQLRAIDVEKEKDLDIIAAIMNFISPTKPTPQSQILTKLAGPDGFSRRRLVYCLKRWSCPAEEGGLWVLKKGDANSNCYQLLDQPPPN